MDLVFFTLLIAAVVWLPTLPSIQRLHRRTHLPRAPLGADAEVDRDLPRLQRDVVNAAR